MLPSPATRPSPAARAARTALDATSRRGLPLPLVPLRVACWLRNFGLVLLVAVDPVADTDELIGAMGGGSVELELAGTGDGAYVTGELSGPLVYFPF